MEVANHMYQSYGCQVENKSPVAAAGTKNGLCTGCSGEQGGLCSVCIFYCFLKHFKGVDIISMGLR